MVETEDEGRGGKQGDEAKDPPRIIFDRQEESHKAREGRGETEAEQDEEEEAAEGDREGETPRGELVEVNHVCGGMCPHQSKMRTSQDSAQNVRTC